MVCRGTSKKIRAMMKNKGDNGEHLCTNPSYGYGKNPDNPKQWVVDEVAAATVKRRFVFCLDGYGPLQIARTLEADKVLTPSAYWQENGVSCLAKPPENPYRWVSATVSDILEKRDYLVHTVNFKTYKQSYKSKKKLYNPEDKQKVFKDRHEAMIAPDTWEHMQLVFSIVAGYEEQLRQAKRELAVKRKQYTQAERRVEELIRLFKRI